MKDNINYEEAVQEIEKITRELESGTLPLDEAVACYKRAMELSAFCVKKLDVVEKEIKVLQETVDGIQEVPHDAE